MIDTRLGLTGFTHLFNAMRPLSSREPGPVAAALESPNAFYGIIVDGEHVAPAMLRLAIRGGTGHPMLVTDAMPPVGVANRNLSSRANRSQSAMGGAPQRRAPWPVLRSIWRLRCATAFGFCSCHWNRRWLSPRLNPRTSWASGIHSAGSLQATEPILSLSVPEILTFSPPGWRGKVPMTPRQAASEPDRHVSAYCRLLMLPLSIDRGFGVGPEGRSTLQRLCV